VETTTTDPQDTIERRANVHTMWASVADGWRDHADDADARGSALTETMLDLVAPRPGERVLELACGPGGVGLAAATRVGAAGVVVVSDVVPEMTAIAAARARARGLTNVRTAVLDLEEIDAPDESYDVVVCREGLMFAVDPSRAAREIHRVLRPGGRVAVAVWGPRARNPWLALVLDAVSAQLGMPVPPPGIPGPFALDDAATLVRVLADASLTDTSVREVAVPLHAAGFDEWWSRTRALAGPLASIVESLPVDTRAALVERLRDAVAPYRTGDGLTLPGLSLLAAARRAR
jgi:ubiquinone/menaquinone biosynthesis C-methylase UbiE